MNKLLSLPKAKLIPVLVVGLLVAGVAGATLVPYLSNLIQTITGVKSPTELKLYDENKNPMPNDFSIDTTGGSTVRFFKIVKSNSNNPVPMAIALVVRDVDMNNKAEVKIDKKTFEYPELEVLSAGPCGGDGYTEKCVYYAGETPGLPYNWESTCWCQNESQAWYIHGQCSDGKLGTKYDDTMVVEYGGKKYSVILFGGTFDGNGLNAKVTKTGWGTPDSCNEATEPTLIAAGGYDTGKVKVTFGPNLTPGTYYLRTQVVMPGSTVNEILAAMGW